MKLIIDIPQKVNEHIRSWYGHGYFPQNGEDRNIIAKAIYDATLIPDNTTNGDVIKAMFPNAELFNEESTCVTLRFDCGEYIEYVDFYDVFWNAPYQRGGTNEQSAE